MTEPLLEVENLECAYGGSSRRPARSVVRDVSFAVVAGETVALVGESGSGKTTIARSIAGLLPPRSGRILFDGQEIGGTAEGRPPHLLREIQFVFQNPDSSLNPRRRVAYAIGRPLELFFGLSGKARSERIAELLDDVHLDSGYMRRYPSQLSGGERQRVAIARALAAEPKLMLCDEVVSALDVSVQAAILDLLRELQEKRGLAMVFIAHDLAVVRWLAHRVVVLYRGRVLEEGAVSDTFSPPVHPYTEALLRSVPEPGVALDEAVEADVPEGRPGDETGCPFASQCPRHLGPVCDETFPPFAQVGPGHALLCHIPARELAEQQAFPWDEHAKRENVRVGSS